jgi:hypothetical protein
MSKENLPSATLKQIITEGMATSFFIFSATLPGSEFPFLYLLFKFTISHVTAGSDHTTFWSSPHIENTIHKVIIIYYD